MTATQLPLFDSEEAARPARQRRRFFRVQADPDVGGSVVRRAELGCDLRSAFVSFWGSLPPERRAELRARIAA